MDTAEQANSETAATLPSDVENDLGPPNARYMTATEVMMREHRARINRMVEWEASEAGQYRRELCKRLAAMLEPIQRTCAPNPFLGAEIVRRPDDSRAAALARANAAVRDQQAEALCEAGVRRLVRP